MNTNQPVTPHDQPPAGLLLCRDLFFTSKITGTAAALGMKMDIAGSVADAVTKLAATNYRCLFVNLDESSYDIAALQRELPRDHRPIVIAFAAHVAEAAIDAARAAGCDQVLSRGLLSSTLPELLKRFLI
jgi:CheY-like chemotaxis protein